MALLKLNLKPLCARMMGDMGERQQIGLLQNLTWVYAKAS